MSIDVLRTAAVAAIEGAFPVDPVPPVKQVWNHHCEECGETAMLFAGKKWPDIKVTDLLRNPSPSLLTPTAFRYYLPAMMLRSIEDLRALDCFPDSLVHQLSPPGGKLSEHARPRLTGFTGDQIEAIIAFLRYFEALQLEDDPDDEAGRRGINRAVKYWRGQLEPPPDDE